MYLISITFCLCLTYLILFFLFPYFFQNKLVRHKDISFVSISLLFILSFLGYMVAFSITNLEVGNRFLHAFGGGFLSFLVCFLAAKDSKTNVTKLQFFIFSLLIVTSLGVINEILEFFLQNYLGFRFSNSINDTWLDLISNAVGMIVGSLVIVPFARKKSKNPL